MCGFDSLTETMRRQEDRAPERSSCLDSTSVAAGTDRRAQAASEQPATRLSPRPPPTGGGKVRSAKLLHFTETAMQNTDTNVQSCSKKESLAARVKANYCEFHIKERPQVQKCRKTTKTCCHRPKPPTSKTGRNLIDRIEPNHAKLDRKMIFPQINEAINFPSFSERRADRPVPLRAAPCALPCCSSVRDCPRPLRKLPPPLAVSSPPHK